jgi:hypothetical protein
VKQFTKTLVKEVIIQGRISEIVRASPMPKHHAKTLKRINEGKHALNFGIR